MNTPSASNGGWSVLVGASNEADLLGKARNGDHTAYVALLQLHDAHLRRFVFNSFGSTTIMDDVLEEVYLDSYSPLRAEVDEPPFGTWLFRRVFESCENARDDLPKDFAEKLDSELAVALLEMPLDNVAAISMVAGEMVDQKQAASLLKTDTKPFAGMVKGARTALNDLELDESSDAADADELIAAYRPARHNQDFWTAINRSFGPAPKPMTKSEAKATKQKATKAPGARRLPRILGVLVAGVLAILAVTAMFGGASEPESGDEGSAPAPVVVFDA